MYSKNHIWFLKLNYIFHKILQYILVNFHLVFDSVWYEKQYPDVVESGQDPLKHWIFFGISENRDPTNYMFTLYYRNQVIKKNFLLKFNPALHYIIVGKINNLLPHPMIELDKSLKEKSLQELSKIDLDRGILRTPFRINISPHLGHVSSLFHKKSIYVSNVKREGEITVIRENMKKNLELEIYKLEKYSLKKIFLKEMNSLNFIIPSGANIVERKRFYNFENERSNLEFIQQIKKIQQKEIKDISLSIEEYNYLLDNWYKTLDLDDFNSDNIFLAYYHKCVNEALDVDKYVNLKERANLIIIRELLFKYFSLYNPFIDKLDINQVIKKTRISIIISTKRPKFLRQLLGLISSQTFKNYEILIALHGMSETDASNSRQLINEFADIYALDFQVWNFSSDSIISEILNTLITHCKYELITKLDDDDLYGENHLLDIVVYAVYTNADFLGKSPMFIYDEASKALYFDNQQYKYFDNSDEISGSSMTFKKSEVLNLGGIPLCVKNPDYVLRQLFKNNKKKIFRIYGYNHIIYRSNLESHMHTWHDSKLLSNKIKLMQVGLLDLIKSQTFWKL